MINPTLEASGFANILQNLQHSIKPSAHMTAGEAAFLLGTMPDEVVDVLRRAPRFRLPGESADAYLVRARFQRALKINDTFTQK